MPQIKPKKENERGKGEKEIYESKPKNSDTGN
jgi:hypothetical protein